MPDQFDSWIDQYLHAIEDSEPSRLFKEWCAVSAICSALQRKVWLDWELGQPIYTNMYIILCGPAAARKGTAQSFTSKLLHEVGIPVAPSSGSMRGIFDAFKDAEVEVTKGFVKPYKHTSLSIMASEFTVFMGRSDHCKEFIDNLCDLFDCLRKFEHRTKFVEGVELHNVWCHMLACTTPDHIKDALPLYAIQGGLMSRTVLVYAPQKEKWSGNPISNLERQAYNLRFDKLAAGLKEIAELTGPFSWTPAFQKAYTEWYEGQQDVPCDLEYHKNFGQYIGRRQNHVRKVAMAFCAARTDDMILDIQDWNRALDLLERTEAMMPQVYAGYGSNPFMEVYQTILGIVSKKGIIHYDSLLREVLNDVSDERLFRRLIATLERANVIRIAHDPKAEDLLVIFNDPEEEHYQPKREDFEDADSNRRTSLAQDTEDFFSRCLGSQGLG